MRDFKHRYGEWALITGASAGIGAEFARQLATQGLNLVLVARRQERLDALAASLQQTYGVAVQTVCADLSVPGSAEELAATCADLEIAIFINNAGASAHHGRFLERDLKDVEAVLQFNVVQQMKLIHLFGKPMAARGRGAIIQVSSITGHVSMPYLVEYSSTKAFQLTMGEALHFELRRQGIDVLVLSPAATKTERIDYGMEVEPVVTTALKQLGKRPSIVPGWLNFLRAWRARQLWGRKTMVNKSGRFQEQFLKGDGGI